MTISKIGNGIIIGSSSDTKPTTGVTTGSIFLEDNTGFVYYYTGSAWTAGATAGGGGSGEANTYSTVGTGAAWTLTKSGVNLPFRSFIVGSSKLSLTTNTNDLTLDVNQANLAIAYSQLTSVPTNIAKTDTTQTFTTVNSFDEEIVVKESTAAAVANPASTYQALYIDSTSHVLSRKNSSGTVTAIEGGGGSGEANTVSNIGTAGVGIYKQKTGVNFELKKLNTSSTAVTITDDTTNNEVDIDLIRGVGYTPSIKKQGCSYGAGGAGNATHQSLLTSSTDAGTLSTVWDTSEGTTLQCATGTTSNSNGGLISATTGGAIGRRSAIGNLRLNTRCAIDSTSNSRVYAGFTSATSLPKSDTPLASGDSGVLVGFRTTDANWSVFRNDGTTGMTVSSLGVAKDTAFHTIDIVYNGTTNVVVTFDGTPTTFTTILPATSATQYSNVVGQNSTTTGKTFTYVYIEVEGV